MAIGIPCFAKSYAKRLRYHPGTTATQRGYSETPGPKKLDLKPFLF
jgi:hypothetical protein